MTSYEVIGRERIYKRVLEFVLERSFNVEIGAVESANCISNRKDIFLRNSCELDMHSNHVASLVPRPRGLGTRLPCSLPIILLGGQFPD